MNSITITQAKELLLKEYPQFHNTNLTITKQFQAQNGRLFNTFLCTSSLSGFETFVAKGVVLERYGLDVEYKVLSLLANTDIAVPTLLVANHQPQHFLLLEYIPGPVGAEEVKDADKTAELFKQVGITTGALHSVSVESFGNLVKPEVITWSEQLQHKLTTRMEGSQKLVESELYQGIVELYHELQPIIAKESTGKPHLIHRDIYLENFIFSETTEEAVLLDFGMCIGGKPFYDLGKFYICELYHYPQYKGTFLTAYSQRVDLPDDFHDRLKLYIFTEALGMVWFFNSVNDDVNRDHAIRVLEELVSQTGTITNLLS